MGQLFRSREMQMIQIFLQLDSAHDTLEELGRVGVVQFRDLNPDVNAFHRHFINEVKRMDEMERRLRYFELEIQRLKEETGQLDTNQERESGPISIDYLVHQFEEYERELLELSANQKILDQNYREIIELKHILEAATTFFEGIRKGQHMPAEGEGEAGSGSASNLNFLSGVIARDRLPTFERTLWRMTRGNLLLSHYEIGELIRDPETNAEEKKDVFFMFVQGDKTQMKIRKVCEAYNARIYQCPDESEKRCDRLIQVNAQLDDLLVVIERTIERRRAVLGSISTTLEHWKLAVAQEKYIYHTMNMFNYDLGRRCLIGEGWCPTDSIELVRVALERGTTRSGSNVAAVLSIVDTDEAPPTFHRTDKLTSAFQSIVDMYGIARYQEVNPAVFTIITFPFLFGVMFGDVGHGAILTLFTLPLVLFESKLQAKPLSETVQTFFDARYLLVLMGFFSIWSGFMYNECFAVPMYIFPSDWRYVPGQADMVQKYTGYTYPIGVDPAWKGANNELSFYNSLKMKMSLIFGVAHMTFGIILSLLNAIHYRKKYDILFQFVPQMVFFLSIFGYMIFLIFLKWSIDWSHRDMQAPLLLNLLVEMLLPPFILSEKNHFFPGQQIIQWILILLAAVSVPMMLLPKPLLMWLDHKRAAKAGTPLVANEIEMEALDHEEKGEKPASKSPTPTAGHGNEHGEEFDLSEVFIHQIIHTIEFVLGSISNTASYLRLWALSLAHSELATVFLDRVLLFTMEMNFFPALVFGFYMWASATLGILLGMESLSAYLHTLRLHWVEFQNKFYLADGYQFVPFSFQGLLKQPDQ